MGKVYFCHDGERPVKDNPAAKRPATELVAAVDLRPSNRLDNIGPEDGPPKIGERTPAGDIADPRHVLVLLEADEDLPPAYQPPFGRIPMPWTPGWYVRSDLPWRAARQALGLPDVD